MRSRRTALRVGRRRGSDRAPKGARRLFLVVCSCRLHRCARGRRMCSYAWIDFRGGCALLSAQGRRPWEPSASTGTSFGWRDDVELFTTLALVVRSYSHNRLWGFKRVCGSILGFLRERCAVLGRRSIWAVSSARGCVAGWDWRLMGQCCVFRQLHTDLATDRVLESRATVPLPPKSGGGWWLAGSGARCLIGALMRTLFWGPRAGPGSNPCVPQD